MCMTMLFALSKYICKGNVLAVWEILKLYHKAFRKDLKRKSKDDMITRMLLMLNVIRFSCFFYQSSCYFNSKAGFSHWWPSDSKFHNTETTGNQRLPVMACVICCKLVLKGFLQHRFQLNISLTHHKRRVAKYSWLYGNYLLKMFKRLSTIKITERLIFLYFMAIT